MNERPRPPYRRTFARLLGPRLIVPVGGLAIKRLLGARPLGDAVGRAYELDHGVAIPLPHPSGASSWPNLPANREKLQTALELVRYELAQIG